jgi:flavin reductase (DIM6/NTAB) family NADH-FMN oxidoreductase RutF
MPARQVAAPLIGECFANMECSVVDVSLVDKYEIFVLEVVRAWIDPPTETTANDSSSRVRELRGRRPVTDLEVPYAPRDSTSI